MNSYQRALPGSEFTMSADEWNAVREASLNQRRNIRVGGSPLPAIDPHYQQTITVINKGSSVGRFSPVVLDSYLNESDELDVDVWCSLQDAFRVKTTFARKHRGRWGVLLQGLGVNQVGLAAFRGIIKCKIDLKQTYDLFVDVETGSTLPVSGLSGSARILGVNGGVGTADATGEQWAVIDLLGVQTGAYRPFIRFDNPLGGACYNGTIMIPQSADGYTFSSTSYSGTPGLQAGPPCVILHQAERTSATTLIENGTIRGGHIVDRRNDSNKIIVSINDAFDITEDCQPPEDNA